MVSWEVVELPELQMVQLVLQIFLDAHPTQIQKQQSPELTLRIESTGRLRAGWKRRGRGVQEELGRENSTYFRPISQVCQGTDPLPVPISLTRNWSQLGQDQMTLFTVLMAIAIARSFSGNN
jgi:hypothetical protein